MKHATMLIALGFMTACTAPNKPIQTVPVQGTAQADGRSTPKKIIPPDTGEPALHAVRDQQLEQVMMQINALVYGQMHGEIDQAREKKLRTQEVARIAHELAGTVDVMKRSLPGLNLSPSEKDTFSALAAKLQADALHIEADANQGKVEHLPEHIQQITTTCTSCHALFRKSRNLLDRCRDPKNTC